MDRIFDEGGSKVVASVGFTRANLQERLISVPFDAAVQNLSPATRVTAETLFEPNLTHNADGWTITQSINSYESGPEVSIFAEMFENKYRVGTRRGKRTELVEMVVSGDGIQFINIDMAGGRIEIDIRANTCFIERYDPNNPPMTMHDLVESAQPGGLLDYEVVPNTSMTLAEFGYQRISQLLDYALSKIVPERQAGVIDA